jgi:hypothetical protein
MGSGETSPTMTATHRELFGRLGDEVAAVLLETPYAFQENKAEISAKAKRYFGDSVGRPVDVLPDLGAGADALAAETALARLRAARWAFAGPAARPTRWTAGAAPRSPPLSPSCCSGAAARSSPARPPAPSAPARCPSTRSTRPGSPPAGWRAWTSSLPPACGWR